MNKLRIILAISLISATLSCSNYQKEYYESGKIKAVYKTDKEGLWVGVYKQYYENGKLMFECDYSAGYPNGIAKYYYPSGQQKEIRHFNNGQLCDTIKCYDSIGNLYYFENYIKGQKVGYGWYEKNGELFTAKEFTDTTNLPKIEDLKITFSHRPDTFTIGDTTMIDIRHKSISKFQIEPSFSNGYMIYDVRKDSFMISFTPLKEGRAFLVIDLKINSSIHKNIGSIEYKVVNKN